MEDLRITPEAAAEGDFLFVDARSEKAWGKATDKIPGAIRVPPDQVAEHLAELPPGKSIVAYCT